MLRASETNFSGVLVIGKNAHHDVSLISVLEHCCAMNVVAKHARDLRRVVRCDGVDVGTAR